MGVIVCSDPGDTPKAQRSTDVVDGKAAIDQD